MRLIDADVLIEKEERYELDRYIDGERCYEMAVPSCAIIEAPTIEIVRCKDCKWYKPYLKQFEYTPRGDGNCRKARMTADGLLEINTSDDDFCSYGARMTDSEKPNNCESKICDTCRYYNSNIPCGSTPSACKEADKFAQEFVDGLKKLKPKDEFFREPTAEERKAVADYIDSISVPTGVNVFDFMDEQTERSESNGN